MTTDTTIDNPAAEFAGLPADAQQSLLRLYTFLELMLPEERASCAFTYLTLARLQALSPSPLTPSVAIEVIDLLVMADREESQATERRSH